jgi:agmatinase
VVGVGGDHSTVYGIIRAYAEKYPGLGVLHVDAHADLRDAYEGFTWSHASIFHNVMTRLPGVSKLVQVGIRDLGEAEFQFSEDSGGRIVTHYDARTKARQHEGVAWRDLCVEMVSALPQDVYVSFDIDGLDPTLCPHTGTPVPGGLSFAEASTLIGEVVRSGRKIVGLDLNEVAPGLDSEWDGNVGARLLYKMIGWMQRG